MISADVCVCTTHVVRKASDIKIKAREVLHARDAINAIFEEKTGQSIEKITSDCSRTKYLTPDQAKEYGLVDKVLTSTGDHEPSMNLR